MKITESEPSRERPVSAAYVTVLRRYAGSILLVTLAAVGGAFAVTRAQTPLYTSVVTVVVQPQAFSNAEAPDMGTEREIAASGAVAAVAAEGLDVPLDGVAQGLDVSVPVETHVLRLSYTSPSPAEAQRRASAFAEAYIKYRATQISQVGTPAGTELEDAQARVITTATLPDSPSRPNYPLNLGVALLIGVILGVATAAVRDRLNDRLRGVGDLGLRTMSPVLATVPPVRRLRAGEGAPLAVLRAPDSATAEAFRYLRAKLLHAPSVPGSQTLVVTSAVEDEGRTVTAANLAVALALSGKRVVLVCADLRNQQLPQLFSVNNDVGLSQVVSGDATIAQALHDTGVESLRLVPPGPLPSRPGDLLMGSNMRQILADLCGVADLVMVETPPVLASADTMALVRLADVTVLVADVRRSTRRGVQDASLEIEQAGGRLVGSVLTVGQRTTRAERLNGFGDSRPPMPEAPAGAYSTPSPPLGTPDGREPSPSKVADAMPDG